MDNKIIIGALIVVALLVGGYLYFATGATITVEGKSVVKSQPDEVSVQILIQTKNLTMQQAQSSNNDVYAKTVDGLKYLGFNDSNIKLDSYNSYEDYSWDGNKQVKNGYVVTRQVSLKIDNFARVSSVIDSIVDSGATVNYINFELSQKKQNELKTQALKEAGQDAKSKADATAEGVGKSTGRLVSIQLVDFGYYPYPLYANSRGMEDSMLAASEAKSAAVNIAPQDLEVPATVRATYKIGIF